MKYQILRERESLDNPYATQLLEAIDGELKPLSGSCLTIHSPNQIPNPNTSKMSTQTAPENHQNRS